MLTPERIEQIRRGDPHNQPEWDALCDMALAHLEAAPSGEALELIATIHREIETEGLQSYCGLSKSTLSRIAALSPSVEEN